MRLTYTLPRYIECAQHFYLLEPPCGEITASLSCVLSLTSSLDLVDPRVNDIDAQAAVS